jgi:hypothetical protein
MEAKRMPGFPKILIAAAFFFLFACCGSKKDAGPTTAGSGPGGSLSGDSRGEHTGPRSTIEGTVQQLIDVLEAGDYYVVFTDFLDPADQEVIEEKGLTIGDLVESFGMEKSRILIQVLREVRRMEPEMSDDGNTATFVLEGELAENAPSDTFIMVKVKGRWYIKN